MKLRCFICGFVALSGIAIGCAKTEEGGTDSNTNFQLLCDGRGDCAGGLTCECGLCTRPCASNVECDGLATDAECLSPSGESAAGCTETTSLCTTRCSSDADCRNGLGCLDGACVAPGGFSSVDAGAHRDAVAPGDDAIVPSQDSCARPETYTCTEPFSGLQCAGNTTGEGVPGFRCGLFVGSSYDESGCALPTCTSDEDCSEGEVCVGPGATTGGDGLTFPRCNRVSSFFCEDDSDGTCVCSQVMDCRSGSSCLPREVVPEAFLGLNCRDGRPYASCEEARDDLDEAIAIFSAVVEENTEDERLWLSECASAAAGALYHREGCEADACAMICELHPCETTPDCVDRCRAFDDATVYGMLENAARTPGMCTCDLCRGMGFAPCAEIWGCQQG